MLKCVPFAYCGRLACMVCVGISTERSSRLLGVTPQAVSIMPSRHRRSIKPLRGAMELNFLSACAVNALGRHSVRTCEQARQTSALECLADERNRGRKTVQEIARWMVNNSGVNPP